MPRVPAAERRAQLVAAAFRVAARDGFGALTTRAVCAEAEAPLATFHYCFASKQELLAELTEQTMNALFDPSRVELGPDVRSSLRAILRAYWATVQEEPEREPVLMALTQYALHEPGLEAIAERQYEAYHRTAQATLELVAGTAGARWTLPLPQLARMLVAVTDGVTLAWLIDRDADAALDALDAFADSLASHSTPSGIVEP
jgi:TetR/AcrR family transcriptional regulator, regulator of biofilm formation and stress response